MKLLVFDFPGITSQHYDQLCCSLNHGAPLSTLAEFRRAGIPGGGPHHRTTPDGG